MLVDVLGVDAAAEIVGDAPDGVGVALLLRLGRQGRRRRAGPASCRSRPASACTAARRLRSRARSRRRRGDDGGGDDAEVHRISRLEAAQRACEAPGGALGVGRKGLSRPSAGRKEKPRCVGPRAPWRPGHAPPAARARRPSGPVAGRPASCRYVARGRDAVRSAPAHGDPQHRPFETAARPRDDPRRRRGQAPLPAHARPREARRPLRRALPHHRHRPLELRQLGPAAHQGAHAVQERVARGAHRARLAPLADPRPVHRGHPRAAAHRQDLVPGSADAVYQSQHVINDEKPELVCIFGGDHVYKMDVRQMLAAAPRQRGRRHRRGDPRAAAPRRATSASSRSTRAAASSRSTRRSRTRRRCRAGPTCASRRWATTSSRPTSLLRGARARRRARDERARLRPRHPPAHGRRTAAASSPTTSRPTACPARTRATRYWRDVGTIDAYWEAQMDLIAIQPRSTSTTSAGRSAPGATTIRRRSSSSATRRSARVGIATDSLVSHGCIISGGRIHRSVLGVGCRVNSFSEIEESVLFENVRIGRHAKIRRAIIDKDVEIPAGHRHRLRPRGGSPALLRDRGRHRRHPEARQARRRARATDVEACSVARRCPHGHRRRRPRLPGELEALLVARGLRRAATGW